MAAVRPKTEYYLYGNNANVYIKNVLCTRVVTVASSFNWINPGGFVATRGLLKTCGQGCGIQPTNDHNRRQRRACNSFIQIRGGGTQDKSNTLASFGTKKKYTHKNIVMFPEYLHSINPIQQNSYCHIPWVRNQKISI